MSLSADKNRFLPTAATVRLGVVLVILFGTLSFSQAQNASPYSRYGLGYLRTPAFSANRGMAELAAPYATSQYVNFVNPASYASINRSAIQMGVSLDGSSILVKNNTYKSFTGSFDHLAFGFSPKPNVWGISLGLVPYSNVNYTFTEDKTDSVIGAYRGVYSGSGSLYQAYVGGAYKTHGFSIGANLGYLFGKLDYEKAVSFPDSLLAYNTRNVTSMNISSFAYNVGAQYQVKIYHNSDTADSRSEIFMTIGAYGNGGVKMNATVNSRWERFVVSSSGVLPIDTQQLSESQKSKIAAPMNVGAGVMFGNELFWMIGADFRYSNWQGFNSPLHNNEIGNSWRVNIGGQVIPSYGDRGNYLARVQYRFGGYFGKSEAQFQGTNLNDYGGTIGFGFPFKATRFFQGSLNLSGNYGSRGGSSTNVIRENYYHIAFGFVLNDREWFIKRKFD